METYQNGPRKLFYDFIRFLFLTNRRFCKKVEKEQHNLYYFAKKAFSKIHQCFKRVLVNQFEILLRSHDVNN